MKFFQEIQKPLSNLGIDQKSSLQNKVLTSRNVLVLLLSTQFLFFLMAFLFIDAKTLREYTDSFYICSSVFLNYFMFISFVKNAQKLFDLINGFESISIERKCQ